MQILAYIIPGILLGIINYVWLTKKKDLSSLLISIINFTLFFNIFFLGVSKLLLHKENILSANIYTAGFTLKYILALILVGLAYLFIKGIIYKKVECEKVEQEKSTKRVVLKVFLTIFFAIGFIFIFFAKWFIDYFGNITPEQFLFNLKSPLKGTASNIDNEIMGSPVLAIITALVVAVALMNISYNIYIIIKGNKKRIISKKMYDRFIIVLSIICMVGGVAYGSNKLHLKAVAREYFENSKYIKDNYVSPQKADLQFPKKKRNIIHIYLESVENSYLPKELGGYMDKNLMPGLTELSKEGYSFSHNDKFGGPNQTYGSSWSVASMVNMGCGIPLKVPMNGNSYGKNGTFLPGVTNMGDILKAEGYNQTIMFGADADFGGLTTYFKTHGDYKIFDLKYARKTGLIPKKYKVWWGYEDEKLFKYAKDEITRLSKAGKPFNFTMETADTHFPDGYLSPNAPKLFDKQYANVIHFSDKQTVEFVKWIQKQPFYDNTTIVLTGDHLSMDKKFFKGWDPNYRRSIFNLILNPACNTKNAKLKNREYAPLDFFPTILASMGVKIKGDRVGLGTNLFSDKKTLVERDGVNKFNDELSINSRFYIDKFVDIKKSSEYKPNKK